MILETTTKYARSRRMEGDSNCFVLVSFNLLPVESHCYFLTSFELQVRMFSDPEILAVDYGPRSIVSLTELSLSQEFHSTIIDLSRTSLPWANLRRLKDSIMVLVFPETMNSAKMDPEAGDDIKP